MLKTPRWGVFSKFKVQSSKFKFCALRATLSTGLLRHFIPRNETERYAKVAARTQSAGDTCTKNNIIASVARQSSNMKVRHSAHIYYLCSKKIPRNLAGAGEHKLYFYLHAPCDTATAWFSIHTLPDGVHAEFTNVIVFASAGL